MPIDRKQFIITADGTQIRLFPENYGVLTRDCAATDWKLNVDKAIPLKVALLIFGEYHTNHELRWGDKQVTLDALNALIAEEGEDLPNGKYDTDWELEEVAGGYHVWQRWQEGVEIYNCTITNCAPQCNSGYRDRSALLKLKGIVPAFAQ